MSKTYRYKKRRRDSTLLLPKGLKSDETGCRGGGMVRSPNATIGANGYPPTTAPPPNLKPTSRYHRVPDSPIGR